MHNPIIPLYKQIDTLIVSAKDCYLYDSDNKQYIDFESGDWSANLGHSNERVNLRIKQQVDQLIHDGLRFRNNESEQLSLKLLEKLEFTGGQCSFLNSGSEAVNLGITIAKNLTGRKKVLKMDCSYLSAFGHGQISDNNADLISIPFNNVDAIAEIDFKEIAVFVFEPGNSSSLIKYPNPDFISKIASEIKKHGGLLMANEVTTGFGRTGEWFGFQHYDYHPDIVSVGKALGNGYPISGVAVSPLIVKLFKKSPFRYAQSHQNDALGCAVGFEVIKQFDELKIIERSVQIGQYFNENLLNLKAGYPDKIKEIRARGLMIALEFDPCISAEKVYLELIYNGILVGQKENILRFMPPLIIDKSHIDILVNSIEKIFSEI